MIIFGTCVADEARYTSIALPSIRRSAITDDVILKEPGRRGIARVYNQFISEARHHSECSALVLLHEDTEIIDDNFRAKIMHLAKNPTVAVGGVAGAAGLRGLEWWTGRSRAGLVYETRGALDLGPRHADVDVVDGLLMIVFPSAFRRFVFDEASFPGFHGYDADYCLQARNIGLRVVVMELDILHRTKTGYGDKEAFRRANEAFSAKWPAHVHRAGLMSRCSRHWRNTENLANTAAKGLARHLSRGAKSASPAGPVSIQRSDPEIQPQWENLRCPAIRLLGLFRWPAAD